MHLAFRHEQPTWPSILGHMLVEFAPGSYERFMRQLSPAEWSAKKCHTVGGKQQPTVGSHTCPLESHVRSRPTLSNWQDSRLVSATTDTHAHIGVRSSREDGTTSTKRGRSKMHNTTRRATTWRGPSQTLLTRLTMSSFERFITTRERSPFLTAAIVFTTSSLPL